MTPGVVYSEDGDLIHLPFYKGVGAFVFDSRRILALISDNNSILNGGFGSPLKNTFLQNLNHWTPPYHPSHFELSQLPLYPTSAVPQQFGVGHLEFPKPRFTTAWKPDVRQEHKSNMATVADPVDLVSGAFYIDEIDLNLPGPFPLDLRRNYNSQSPIPGPLGFGWKLSLNPLLVEEGDKLYAAEEDGTVIVYRFHPEHSRWEVLQEDNPDLTNFSKRGIGGKANPFHGYIEKKEGYILHGPDGSKRTFENLLLKEWKDPAGHTLNFSYKEDRLTRVESSNGSFFTIHYNHEGMIDEIHAKDGRVVKYTYDSQYNLSQVLLPNNATVTYEYDHSHQIIRETKPHGKVLENIYKEGKVVEQRSPVGPQQQMFTSALFDYQEGCTTATELKEFSTDPTQRAGFTTEYRIFQNQIYKITDPEKHEILQSWFIDQTTWFDAEAGVIKQWSGPGAWPRSLKSSKDKRGLTTEYLYDSHGNIEKITLSGEDLTGDGEQTVSKSFTYNDRNLCEQEKTLNKTTLTTYDPKFPYQPKRIENYADQTLISYVDLEYNPQGLLQKEDHCGAITLWDYDARGFPSSKIQKTGTDDPDVVETYRFNDQGQCIEKNRADGTQRDEYDIMGNSYRTRIYRPSGEWLYTTLTGHNLNNQVIWKEGVDPRNTLFFDLNASGLVKATRQSLTQIDSNLNDLEPAGTAFTLYEYDHRGHLSHEIDALGFVTERTYDGLGRIVTETKEGLTTHFAYEAGGMLAKVTSSMGGETKYSYTTNGLLKKEVFPDGTENSYVYDFLGRPILETKNGIAWEITYEDALRRVTRTHKKTRTAEVREFDFQGNLISVRDGEGFVWQKTYDALHRIKTETAPDGYQTTWNYLKDQVISYVPSGERTIQRYELGQLIESQTYNSQNELIARVSFKHTPESSIHQEIYDDQVTTTWMNTFGQPVLSVTGNLTTTHQYNALGQCIASIDGEGAVTRQKFDALGRLKEKQLPDGALLEYEYDEDSNLQACHLPGKMSWIATYDSMGRKAAEELQAGGKVSENWKYSYVNGYLKEIEDPLGNIQKHDFDEHGRLKEKTISSQKKTYAYDNRGLLKSIEQTGDSPSRIERSYNSSGYLDLERIYLGSTLIQESIQTWEPTKRTLQIGDHERTFHLQRGRLSKLSTPKIELEYKYSTSGALIQRSSPYHSSILEYNDSALPKVIDTQYFGGIRQEFITWDRSGKLTSFQSNESARVFSYTPRGYLQTSNEEKYEFDFAVPGRGIRTKAGNSQVPEDGLDPFGKILSEVIENKLLTTVYNPKGQVESRSTPDDQQLFTWDVWGQLTGITSTAFTWQASYDPLGRRIQTTYTTKEGASLLTSLYDPEEEFQEIGVKTNNKTYWKLYGPSSCDAVIDETGEAAVLIRDILGNLIGISSSQSNLSIAESPSPYGSLTATNPGPFHENFLI
jgi:YD repeat-containing protein